MKRNNNIGNKTEILFIKIFEDAVESLPDDENDDGHKKQHHRFLFNNIIEFLIIF